MAEIAIAQEPCELAGSGVLHAGRMQIGSMAEAAGALAVTFRAVLKKKFFARENGFRIAFIRVMPLARFQRRLSDRSKDAPIVGGMNVRTMLVRIVFLSLLRGGGKSRGQRCGQEEGREHGGFHWNMVRTLWPKPEISYETPQRKRKAWLLLLRPKPGERVNLTPLGKSQATRGAK